MNFAPFSRLLHQICRFESRNDFRSNLYSTRAMPSRRSMKSWEESTKELFRRISPVGDPKVSIEPILDRWVEQGRSLDEQGLKDIIRELRFDNRYDHALQISMWMTDKRNFELTSSNAAIRMELISKAQGIEQAEKYFNSLSRKQKGLNVYGVLLKCYATAECVEKAEALMLEMRDIGYVKNVAEYNFMLTLYYKAQNMEKLDALLQEMEEKGIAHDRYTLTILFNAYASVMDIEKMDKIVTVMESDPNVDFDWINYTAAAAGYQKVGLLDKACEMLKKAESHLPSKPDVVGYYKLLTQYAGIGRKDEVLRVWSLYKKKCKVNNKAYSHVLNSLVKLDDIEMAQKIFDEWESRGGLTYDMYIPNVMIGAYSRKGLLEKAEALLDRAVSIGGKPNTWTWCCLVKSYLENDQPQKAVEMMKKVIDSSRTGWKPPMELFEGCLEYLKGVGDSEQTQEFANLLQAGMVIHDIGKEPVRQKDRIGAEDAGKETAEQKVDKPIPKPQCKDSLLGYLALESARQRDGIRTEDAGKETTEQKVDKPISKPQCKDTSLGYLDQESANQKDRIGTEDAGKEITEQNGDKPMPKPQYKDTLLGYSDQQMEDMDGLYSDDGEEEGMEDEECPAISVDRNEKSRLQRAWKDSLIIKLMGRQIGYKYLEERIKELWKPKGQIDTIALDNNYFLVKFASKDDHDHALHEGPWTVLDHYLTVRRWFPNFDPAIEPPKIVMVWVRIHGLPIEYYDEKFLMRLGQLVGKPIKIDKNTSEALRGKFARICVEVDLNKPLICKFKLEKRVRRIEYEGIHPVCIGCGKYGHKRENCPDEKKPKSAEEARIS